MTGRQTIYIFRLQTPAQIQMHSECSMLLVTQVKQYVNTYLHYTYIHVSKMKVYNPNKGKFQWDFS